MHQKGKQHFTGLGAKVNASWVQKLQLTNGLTKRHGGEVVPEQDKVLPVTTPVDHEALQVHHGPGKAEYRTCTATTMVLYDIVQLPHV
jgi:hypothetical protein